MTHVNHAQKGAVFSFDMLPAANFVKTDERNLKGLDVCEVQAKKTLLKLSQKQAKALKETKEISKMDNRLYSSSLSEMTVAYVRDIVKSEYHLKVIRLAKFWIDGTHLKEYVSAKSYMVELIAIHAQKKRKSKRCLVSGFRRFWEAMSQFGQLSISFHGKALCSFKNVKPVMVDVVNPFHNLAHGISPKVVESLHFQSKETLKILKYLRKANVYEGIQDPIKSIFSKKLKQKC